MRGAQTPLEWDSLGTKELRHYAASLMNLLENAGLMAEWGTACLAEYDSVIIARHGTRQLRQQQNYLKKEQISNWLLG